MRDMLPLRERYLEDSLPIRLVGLAANLRRIRSFAVHKNGEEAVVSLSEQRRLRDAVLAGLAAAARSEIPARGPRGGLRWRPRYFVRRVAWHLLDHAWEIEDRSR